MAKNIVIALTNSLVGQVELSTTAPMSNSGRQTAPPFSQTAQYTEGTVTLTGLQETPADQSWHYILHIRPSEPGLCSLDGSHQARFFLPNSVTSPVNLTELIQNHSAW